MALGLQRKVLLFGMEKDEILLYFTAFLGVVLPFLVFLLYRNLQKSYYFYFSRSQQAEEHVDEQVSLWCPIKT